jgi:predicted ABC-type ATPase
VTPPVFTLIAGANGAGKSTLTSGNPEVFFPFPLLDPDAFRKPISPAATASPIAAGREVLRLAKEYLERHQSFSIETTLSGKNYLEMMIGARTLGFEIVLVYIGTEKVEINLSRIAQRVLSGGHDVPEVDVRRRFSRSFKNLPVAIGRADHTLLFDNSAEQGYQLLGILSPTTIQWFDPLPLWAMNIKATLSSK